MVVLVMLVLFVCLVTIAAAVFAHKHDGDGIGAGLLGFCVFLLCGIVAAAISIPLIGCTGGMLPGYSTGERIGYLTQASVKGAIWKTNEVQLQVGSGEMAALQGPHPFSIPDRKLFDEAQSRLGEKCRVKYSQWGVMPWWVGKSGYEVTSIEYIEGK